MFPTPAPLIGDEPDRSHPLMDGLAVWYPFSECGGSRAFNAVANVTDCTLGAATSRAYVNVGPAVVGDATAAVATTPNHSVFAVGSGSFAVSAWVKFDTLRAASATGDVIAIKAIGSGSFAGWALRHINTSATGNLSKITFYPYNSGGSQLVGTTVLSAGQWYHVVGTRTGNLCQLWVNGKKEAQLVNTSNVTSTASLLIGGLQAGWDGGNLDGCVQDFRFYARGLSPSDISDIYSDPWAPFARRRVYGFAPAAGGGGSVQQQLMLLGTGA